MYICKKCNFIFNVPKEYEEKHGLDTPPYEKIYGCPQCGGDYEEAIECDWCGEIVRNNDYIKYKKFYYCRKCYTNFKKKKNF